MSDGKKLDALLAPLDLKAAAERLQGHSLLRDEATPEQLLRDEATPEQLQRIQALAARNLALVAHALEDNARVSEPRTLILPLPEANLWPGEPFEVQVLPKTRTVLRVMTLKCERYLEPPPRGKSPYECGPVVEGEEATYRSIIIDAVHSGKTPVLTSLLPCTAWPFGYTPPDMARPLGRFSAEALTVAFDDHVTEPGLTVSIRGRNVGESVIRFRGTIFCHTLR